MIVKTIKYKKVEEVPVWGKSHQMTLLIYKETSKFPKGEIYGITSQLRRAASSVTANITEGFYKGSAKQLLQFLFNARGSLGEVMYFLRLSKDLGYLSLSNYNMLDKICSSVGKQLNGWIKSLKLK